MRIMPIKMVQPLKPEVKKVVQYNEQKQLFKKVDNKTKKILASLVLCLLLGLQVQAGEVKQEHPICNNKNITFSFR